MSHGMGAPAPGEANIFGGRDHKVSLDTRFAFRHKVTKAEQFLYKELFTPADVGKELLFDITYCHVLESDSQYLSITIGKVREDGLKSDRVKQVSLRLDDRVLADSYWSFVKYYCGELDSLLMPFGEVDCWSVLPQNDDNEAVRKSVNRSYARERNELGRILWTHWGLVYHPLEEE